MSSQVSSSETIRGDFNAALESAADALTIAITKLDEYRKSVGWVEHGKDDEGYPDSVRNDFNDERNSDLVDQMQRDLEKIERLYA